MSDEIKKWFTKANECSERLLKACGSQADKDMGKRRLHEVVRDFAVAAIFFDHVKEICMGMTMDLVALEMTDAQRKYLREFVSDECEKAAEEFQATLGSIGHVTVQVSGSAQTSKATAQSGMKELPATTEKPRGDLN